LNRAPHQPRSAPFDGKFLYRRDLYRHLLPADLSVALREAIERAPFFASAAAAEAAGFRPCLRCRPEAAPGTPAWLGHGGGGTARALRLINEGRASMRTRSKRSPRA